MDTLAKKYGDDARHRTVEISIISIPAKKQAHSLVRCSLLPSSLVFLAQLALASAHVVIPPETLRHLVTASSLSYLPIDTMSSSPYHADIGMRAIVQVMDPVSESGATVYADDGENLVVACRGSATPRNFYTNLKFGQVPLAHIGGEVVPGDAAIHGGFQDAALGLWGVLGPHLAGHQRVTFTGHSLGAATALLCAAHHSATATTSVPPSVITFGGPRFVNGAAARHLREDILRGSEVVHVVHNGDPILGNNQNLWDGLGFENVGDELRFADGDSIEATELFYRGFAWNILDHCKYMGVFVGPRLLL